jgi:hypothetical protein
VTGVNAGSTEAVHAKTLEKCFEQYMVPVEGQADVLVTGIPYISPYNVHAFLNPLLVQVLAEGGIVGAIGAAIGLVAGLLLAQTALRFFGGDLGGGYFYGTRPELTFAPGAALAFFALLSSWLLLCGLHRGKASDFVWYGAASALGAYTHLPRVDWLLLIDADVVDVHASWKGRAGVRVARPIAADLQ